MVARGIHWVAGEEPSRLAIVDGDRRVTYGELESMVASAAGAFAAQGVGHGDRVAVMLHNRVELSAAWNAAARVGAYVVPIGYRSTAPEVEYLLGDSEAAVFVHDVPDVAEVAAAAVPTVRAIWPFDSDELWLSGRDAPNEDFLGAAVVCMNYTSGTTGRPKGIERGPTAPARVPGASPYVDFWGFRADDVHLLCGPGYHAAPGGYAQMHLVEGACVVMMRRFDATDCLQLIETERVTNSHMVPAVFVRILEADWQSFDRSSVRKILHAAAPCPVDVKRRIMDVFPPGTIWEYYGMSEGMGTVVSPEEWLERPGTVGRPFPGVALTVHDEDGKELPPGEVGYIYVTGREGQEQFRYRNAPTKTEEAWRGDRFTVGDLGWLDEDGYLFFADRRVDLILSGGVNVYPAEVEAALIAHPEVVDSAVFGLPDARMGQRVHAVVERQPGSQVDVEDLREYLRVQIADFKVPRTIEFVDELPREPNGKVRKRLLRDERVGATEGGATT